MYLPASKLKATEIPFRGYLIPSKKPHELVGILTVTSFTKWSFFLLGNSFLLLAAVPLMVLLNGNNDGSTGSSDANIPSWLLRAALLSFECAGPFTLLVASVVRYALWPMQLKNGKDTGPFKSVRAIFEHNANVVMALTEVALLGGPPVRWQDFSVAPLFGITYVLFAWYMSTHWVPALHGPQFIYFFLDTTLGKWTTIFLLGLLGVLLTFYGLFFAASYCISHAYGGAWVNGLAVAVLSSLVCRFND